MNKLINKEMKVAEVDYGGSGGHFHMSNFPYIIPYNTCSISTVSNVSLSGFTQLMNSTRHGFKYFLKYLSTSQVHRSIL